MKTKDAPTSEEWVAGPALASTADLLAWLDKDGAGKTIDLPVQVTVGALGISKAQLAPPGRTADDTGLLLKLDDSKMGISLKDRLKGHCSTVDACWVWLRGTWGSAIGGAGPSVGGPGGPSLGGPAEATRHSFAVVKVVGAVSDDDQAVVRVRK